VRRTPSHPVNPYIQNGFMADLYLSMVRKGSYSLLRKMVEHLLHSHLSCPVPERLHLPHPYGILAGRTCKLGEDVTLGHFCTLGPKDPWYQGDSWENIYPTLEEGVIVSAGAKVLGPIVVGAWSVIGANAVLTEDVPAFSTVFGHNRILRSTEGGPPPVKRYLEAREKAKK
jgi:serine O-acetyltransferase